MLQINDMGTCDNMTTVLKLFGNIHINPRELSLIISGNDLIQKQLQELDIIMVCYVLDSQQCEHNDIAANAKVTSS